MLDPAAEELYDVVDENDVVLSQASRREVYQKNLCNRIVSIVVRDRQSQKFVIAVRGQNVSWQPLHYAVAACGHVVAGEAWDVAARRELFEELGVDTSVTYVDKFRFTDESGFHFMMGIFTAEADFDTLKPDAREVDRLILCDADQIRAILTAKDKLHNLFPPVAARIF